MSLEIGHRDSFPDWNGALSSTVVPRFVWMMLTDHRLGADIRAEVEKKLDQLESEHGFSTPPEVRKRVIEKMVATIEEAGTARLREYEFHSILVVTEGSKLYYLAGDTHTHMDGKFHDKLTPKLVSEYGVEDLKTTILSAILTSNNMQYTKDWEGIRKDVLQFECSSLEEANAKIKGTVFEEAWPRMFPQESGKTSSPEEIAELEKRFGKRKIAQLIKKMHKDS